MITLLRNKFLVTILLLGGSIFAAYWAAELLDGRLPLNRGAIGFVTMGTVQIVCDLAIRLLVARAMPWRLLHPDAGASIKVVPMWLCGTCWFVGGVLMAR